MRSLHQLQQAIAGAVAGNARTAPLFPRSVNQQTFGTKSSPGAVARAGTKGEPKSKAPSFLLCPSKSVLGQVALNRGKATCVCREGTWGCRGHPSQPGRMQWKGRVKGPERASEEGERSRPGSEGAAVAEGGGTSGDGPGDRGRAALGAASPQQW